MSVNVIRPPASARAVGGTTSDVWASDFPRCFAYKTRPIQTPDHFVLPSGADKHILKCVTLCGTYEKNTRTRDSDSDSRTIYCCRFAYRPMFG